MNPRELTIIQKIEKMIYVIRGQKVMLDSDLAELYGVEAKRLNEQVKRNLELFPEDFVLQLTSEEAKSLQGQFVISKKGRGGKQKLPYVFTENGVAMLSSVLNSPRAIQVNIEIMRIFTKLRSFLMMETKFNERIDKLEKETSKIFKLVFECLDYQEEVKDPILSPDRKKIGLGEN